MCRHRRMKQEFTSAECPEPHDVGERALGIIKKTHLLLAPELPSSFRMPDFHHQRCSGLGEHTGRVTSPCSTGDELPYETWHGRATLAPPYPSLCPVYCRWNPPKSSFCLKPGIDHPRDFLGILTRAKRAEEAMDVTWEAPPELTGAPEVGGTSQSGRASELGETPEPRGPGRIDSAPPTPFPRVGRDITHQRRVTYSAKSDATVGVHVYFPRLGILGALYLIQNATYEICESTQRLLVQCTRDSRNDSAKGNAFIPIFLCIHDR